MVQDYPGLTGTSQVLASLTDGVYYTCVTAEDNAGNSTNATNNGLAFTVDAVPPQPFNILGPSGTIGTKTPMVLWQASNGALTYDLIIATSSSCNVAVQQYLNLTPNSQALATLADGTYYICVTAKDTAHTLAATNNGLAFTIDTSAPLAFNIIGPSGFIGSNTPVVSWQTSTGATNYDLVISTSADCATAVQQYTGLTGTSQALTALADGAYFTCVTASDALGNTTTATNDGLSFTVDTLAPAPFSITAPYGTISNNAPSVVWDASTGATTYDLVISTASDCSVVTEQYLSLSTTSQTISSLPDGTYHTCVTAKDPVGHAVTATNNGLAFTVDTTPPLAFSILSPSGTITSNTPNVTWETSVDAVSYDLVISSASDRSVPVQQYLALTGTSQALTALSDGTYYTCVTAEDMFGRLTTAANNGLLFTVTTLKHTIFVTSFQNFVTTDQSFPPTFPLFGNLNDADWICTYAAANVGLVANWDGVQIAYQAILSAPGTNASDRIAVTAPVYNMHGDLIANNKADLWDGTLQNPILYDENGAAPTAVFVVWTGSSCWHHGW